MKTILINYDNNLYVKKGLDENTTWGFLIDNVKTVQKVLQYLEDAEIVDNADVYDFDDYFRFENDNTWSVYDVDFNYWFSESESVCVPENHDELLRQALSVQ